MRGASGTYGVEERSIRGFVFITASHSHTRKHVAIVLLHLLYDFFALTSPCQHIPLLNLRPEMFGLTPFGWLRSSTLISTYSSISYGNIIFYLCLFELHPLFQEHDERKTSAWWCKILVKVNVNIFCSTLKTVV